MRWVPDSLATALLVAAAVISLLICDTTCYIVAGPQNVAAVIGEEAWFNCTSNDTSPEITWNANSDQLLTANEICSIKSTYTNLYKGVASSDSCNIMLYSVTTSSRTLYTCSNGQGLNSKANLLILYEEPKCIVEGALIQGHQVNIVCTVGTVKNQDYEFSGTIQQQTQCEGFPVGPITTISKGGDTQVQHVSFPLNLTGTRLGPLTCDIYFLFQDGVQTEYAAFSGYDPTFQFIIDLPVQYCPVNITVTPATGPYYAGNVLTCYASAYLPAAYSWVDNLNPSSPPVVGSTFTLPASGGPFDVSCTAFAAGNLTGLCNETTTVTGIAVLCPTDVTITPSSKTVVEVGDEFTCTSTSYPAANYTWTDASGDVVSRQSAVVVSETGSLSLTCNATVDVPGTPACWNTATVSVTAIVCPVNVSISPEATVIKVGDVLSCTAVSSPGANYVWYDSADALIATTPSISVSESGVASYKCVASVSVQGTTCSQSAVINVTAVECNRNVAITPVNSEPFVGDVFTCNAPGFPDATYTWHNAGGNLVSTASTVTINDAGDFSLKCTATVSVEGKDVCSNSATITGTAIVTTTTATTTQTSTTTSQTSSATTTVRSGTWTDGTSTSTSPGTGTTPSTVSTSGVSGQTKGSESTESTVSPGSAGTGSPTTNSVNASLTTTTAPPPKLPDKYILIIILIPLLVMLLLCCCLFWLAALCGRRRRRRRKEEEECRETKEVECRKTTITQRRWDWRPYSPQENSTTWNPYAPGFASQPTYYNGYRRY